MTRQSGCGWRWLTATPLRANLAKAVWPPRTSRHENKHDRDVSPDGQRFVMIRDRANAGGRGVVYVENWFSELRAKVAGVKR